MLLAGLGSDSTFGTTQRTINGVCPMVRSSACIFTFVYEMDKSNFLTELNSVALQALPPVLFAAGLPFLPESPRWLILKGKHDAARKISITSMLPRERQGTHLRTASSRGSREQSSLSVLIATLGRWCLGTPVT